jgi:hypothetical protein
LKIIQKGIEASASELLRTQVKETLASFEHSMEELAQHSVGRWQRTLAGGLNSLVKTLGEQFRLEAENEEEQDLRTKSGSETRRANHPRHAGAFAGPGRVGTDR